MEPFLYRDGELYCEGVPLREVAHEFGTPCYVYRYSRIVANYQRFDEAFSAFRHMTAYAVKANSNGAILRILVQEVPISLEEIQKVTSASSRGTLGCT